MPSGAFGAITCYGKWQLLHLLVLNLALVLEISGWIHVSRHYSEVSRTQPHLPLSRFLEFSVDLKAMVTTSVNYSNLGNSNQRALI